MAEHESTGGAFARYRPIAELGQGGMAQVFLALASGPAGFNKLVVIKQIREQFADDPEFLSMFLDEARLAARLNHPNVVQTNEVGGDGKRFYICMEYLEGQPLNRIMTRIGAAKGLTLGMQLRIVVDALTGLHHAHELNDFDGRALEVVHRDATPHNIFVTYAGQVKVVDFGIAKALSSSSETRTGVLKGKVAYMAPEQAMGERVDRRADIFTVGMILWEVLAGKRLFKGVPDVAVLQRIVNGSIPLPSTVNTEVRPELEAIAMKALAHNRDDRYATAADMAAALEAATDASGERGTVRDAGRLINEFFAGERAKIKSLVEAHANENGVGRRPTDDPTTFDPRLSGSGPRLPVLDHPTTHELTGNHGTSSLAGPGSGSIRERPSAPSTLTAATASPLEAAPAKEGRGRMLAGIAAGVVGAAVAVGFFATRGSPTTTQPGTATTATAAPSVHTILIDSTPQGASVREGTKELGKTPMTLDLDPAAAPRRLVMSIDGYSTHTFLPTHEDTRIMVPLAPLPVAAAAPVAPVATADKAAGPATPHQPVTRPVVAPTQPSVAPRPVVPSDINTAR
jgi:serine/threonine protein kinase